MKVRLGKAFLEEVNIRSGGVQDVRSEVLLAVLLAGKPTKTGITVKVTDYELQHLIDECEWYVYNTSPEDSSDDRKIFNNLRNQLKSLKKVQEQARIKEEE